MGSLAENRVVLGTLYVRALGRAFIRYRDARRRAAGRHLDAFYVRAWREAASRLGASYEAIGAGVAEIRLDGVCVRVVDNTCPIDDPVTKAVADNKPLTYRLLRRAGLPTPRHAVFSLRAEAPAFAFLRSEGRSCVVKPAGGTGGGRGVSTGIGTPWQLARAAAAAAVYGDELLIEEYVWGGNYRLLYLDGRLLDAFVREPPAVVGDGRSTVARLVRQANDARLRSRSGVSQVLLTVDLDMERALAGQGLSLGATPAAGALVRVKGVVNENRGADNVSASGRLCPAVVAAGARAAKAVGVRLAGVDLITSNPAVPLEDSGGVILEVNTPPNYYYHYHKRDGSFPVAVHVLESLLLGQPDPAGLEPVGPSPTLEASSL